MAKKVLWYHHEQVQHDQDRPRKDVCARRHHPLDPLRHLVSGLGCPRPHSKLVRQEERLEGSIRVSLKFLLTLLHVITQAD